jgi:hypothetical protein
MSATSLHAARAFWTDEQATDDQLQAVLLIAQQKKFRTKPSLRSTRSAKPSTRPA